MTCPHQQLKPVGMNQATGSRGRYPPKALEMDWSHSTEANVQHYKSSPDLEPTEEEKKRPSKEHLAPGPLGGFKEDGKDLND